MPRSDLGLTVLHILIALAGQERHGYAIMQDVAARTNGRIKLSPGTLYPLLHGMEKKGYLRSRKEHPGRTARTLYRATPLGKKGLALAKSRILEFTGEAMKD